ncbi:MAG: DUF4325 domain-containing protein [Verrucomicrobiota bacterium]
MKASQSILARLRRGPASGSGLARALGVSRQAVHEHLKALSGHGLIVKEGVTRGARYRIAGRREQGSAVRTVRRLLDLHGLEEDRVFDEISTALGLARRTGERAQEIAQYAFSELLNNAIEHSRSPKGLVEARLDPYACSFVIRDYGIGVFQSMAAKFMLQDESAALFEILKGKRTTAPERHSGEGIFFTSKAVDRILFRSHRLRLEIDNLHPDVVVEEARLLKGTEVRFFVARHARRRLGDVFAKFAPEEFDFRFEKTRVLVRLLGNDYVSRSEARRLLAGLDRFKEIELDFEGVQRLGQGFADEIFRVFRRAHPGIALRAVNVRPPLQAMIRHSLDNTVSSSLTIS